MLAALVVAGMNSCGKGLNETCYPYQFYVNGSPFYQFEYQDNELTRIYRYNLSNGQLAQEYEFIRGNDGLLDNVNLYSGSGLLQNTYHIVYNMNKKLAAIYILTDANQDGYAEALQYKIETYYHNNKLDSLAYFDGNLLYTTSTVLTWTDGNITKEEDVVTGDYTLYIYDGHRSIVQPVSTEFFVLANSSVTSLSASNVLTSTSYDVNGIQQSQNTYTYTYDSFDLPATSGSASYEYTCQED